MDTKQKKRLHLFFRIALAGLLVWVVIMLLSQVVEVFAKGSDNSAILQQISVLTQENEILEMENKELEKQVNAINDEEGASDNVSDDLLEGYANSNGYYLPDQLIIIEAPGTK